jgi:hypothetical protein
MKFEHPKTTAHIARGNNEQVNDKIADNITTSLHIERASHQPVNNHGRSRFYRIVLMVYSTQNYWDFGLLPSSGVLRSRGTRRFGNWISFHPH